MFRENKCSGRINALGEKMLRENKCSERINVPGE
jgi:hypothetical protein